MFAVLFLVGNLQLGIFLDLLWGGFDQMDGMVYILIFSRVTIEGSNGACWNDTLPWEPWKDTFTLITTFVIGPEVKISLILFSTVSFDKKA